MIKVNHSILLPEYDLFVVFIVYYDILRDKNDDPKKYGNNLNGFAE